MGTLEPIRSHDVTRATGSTRRIERALAAGELVRVRHGADATPGDWVGADAADRMLAAMVATAGAARSIEPVFVVDSAAALHGIPLIGARSTRAMVLVTVSGSKSNASVTRIRRAEPEDSIVRVGGMLATNPAVTAIDIAARHSVLAGIVAVSHVRGHLQVSLAQLHRELERRRPFPGARRAEIAIRRSTSASDSPLETLVDVRCDDLGFERPEQQFTVVGTNGIADDVDFAWRSGRILGEADGKEKDALGAAERRETISDRIWAEKRREDAIRPRCDRFFRTDWDAAWRGDPLERSLLAAGVPRVRPRRPLTR